MMKLAIIGGALQGMEAAYLAKKAGIRTLLIDRWAGAPAFSLAEEHAVLDVVKNEDEAMKLIEDCDAVLPANEDPATLDHLVTMMRGTSVPLIYDPRACRITSSRLLSNKLMRSLGVPMPAPWPDCGFPVIVKPSDWSRSVGASRADNQRQLEKGIKTARLYGGGVVVQEFISGPSISLEVIGNGSEAVPLVGSQVLFDKTYDRKMVISPPENVIFDEDLLRRACERMAVELELGGIMEVEAMVSRGVPRIIEIDARFPSQTPAAAYHSHGINMVHMLMELFTTGRLLRPDTRGGRVAICEHVLKQGEVLRSKGESALTQFKGMQVRPGLFGSDEMITNYRPGEHAWAGTVICTGSTIEEARGKRDACIQSIMDENSIGTFSDPVPEVRTA
jgi:pyrrolysine biosynthesis protein PylC